MEQVLTWKSHGGTQGVYTHASAETGTPIVFSVFVPSHPPGAKLPVLIGAQFPAGMARQGITGHSMGDPVAVLIRPA